MHIVAHSFVLILANYVDVLLLQIFQSCFFAKRFGFYYSKNTVIIESITSEHFEKSLNVAKL